MSQMVGLIALHGLTSAWIGYGAVMKTLEMNPQLLPPPILKALTSIAKSMPGDSMAFLEGSLRVIIGAEIFLAIAILAWFITWWTFLIAASVVMFALANRQFNSRARFIAVAASNSLLGK